MGTAAWNTYTQVLNTYESFSGIGNAVEGVGDLFSGGGKFKTSLLGILIVIGLLIIAFIGGIFLTVTLVRHYAATRPVLDAPPGPQDLSRRTA